MIWRQSPRYYKRTYHKLKPGVRSAKKDIRGMKEGDGRISLITFFVHVIQEHCQSNRSSVKPFVD